MSPDTYKQTLGQGGNTGLWGCDNDGACSFREHSTEIQPPHPS